MCFLWPRLKKKFFVIKKKLSILKSQRYFTMFSFRSFIVFFKKIYIYIYIFYWSIVDLHCSSFTARWFSYTNKHILFFKLFSVIGYYKILTIVPYAIQQTFVACCIFYFLIINVAFYSYQVKQVESKCHNFFRQKLISFLIYILYIYIYIYMYKLYNSW